MADILADIKLNPEYRAMSVADQLQAASLILDKRLVTNVEYMGLMPAEQKLAKKLLLAKAPTFNDPNAEQGFKDTGTGYISGAAGDETNKNVYEFVQGMIRGSGIASTLQDILSKTPATASDYKRGLDYYKALDHIQNKGSGWAVAGEMVGTTAEMAAISLVLSPATSAVKSGATLALRGGKAALETVKVAKTAAGVATAAVKLPMVHPALEMVSSIAADALVTAAPLYFADEMKRASRGEPSIASEGAGKVLEVLGENAAGNFLWGTITSGLLMTAARLGKSIFSMKPNTLVEAMNRAYATDAEQMKAFLATRDPVHLANMTPAVRAGTIQHARISDYLDGPVLGDPDVQQLAKTYMLAQDTGKIFESVDNGGFNIWELGKDGLPEVKAYSNFNDAKDYLTFRTYEAYQAADAATKAKFTGPESKWFVERGMVLQNQDQLLKSSKATSVDVELGAANELGFKVNSPKERIVITRSEANAFGGNDPLNGAAIQTKIDFDKALTKNAIEGEFNLFKGTGSVRVLPSADGNAVFIGRHGASPEDFLMATQKAQQAVLVEPKLTLEAARASIMLDHGFDYFAHPDGYFEFFTPRNGKLIGTPDDVLNSIAKNAKHTGEGSATAISIQATAKLGMNAKEFVGNPEIVTRAAMQALKGKDPAEMEQLVKLYLEGFEKTSTVKVVQAGVDSTKLSSVVVDKGGIVNVILPNEINGLAAERKYITQLFTDLKTISGANKDIHKGSWFAKQFEAKQNVLDYYKLGKLDQPTLISWLNDTSSKLGLKIKSLPDAPGIVLSPDGMDFKSLGEAVDFVARKTVDPAILTADLKMQGVAITGRPGMYVARDIKSRNVLAKATDQFSLMQEMGLHPKYLDLKYGPSEIRYTPDGIELTLAGRKVVKNTDDAITLIKQFQDGDLIAKQNFLKSSDRGQLSIDNVGNYRVYLSKYDYVKNFDNINEARLFFEREVPSWDNLKDIASKKGVDLTIDAGRYKLRHGTETIFAANQDEFAKALQRFPDLEENVPDIMDALDPSISKDVKSVVDTFMKSQRLRAGPNKYNAPPEIQLDPHAKIMSAWMAFRSSTSQMTSWMRDIAVRTNRPEFLNRVTDFLKGRRLADVEGRMGENILAKALTIDGKRLSAESGEKIFYYLGQQNSEKAAAGLGVQYTRKFGKPIAELQLTAPELKVAENIEGFMKTLGTKFNIQFKDLIYKYMPMLRDFNSETNRGLMSNLKLADELTQKVFGDNVPSSLKFFAEFERTENIFQYAVKDNIFEILSMYNMQGHKKLYMDESWRKLSKYLKDNPIEDSRLVDRMNLYREEIMGYYHSPGEKVVEDFGIRAMRSIKNNSVLGKAFSGVSMETMEGYGKNLLKNYMSLTYLVQLGMKPWTAIRNSFQSLTTLAPRFGLARTLKASDEILRGGNEIFDFLRLRGVITDAAPIVDELASVSGKIGRITQASMAWLKNGDDLSRAVAYRTATNSFQDGLDWLSVHPQDIEGFHRISGLSVIDPNTKRIITNQMMKGETEAAKDAFALLVVKDTAFTNDIAESSMFRQGLVGKLFGQYGSFSESYRANMFNMLKYGSAADRVRMVSTYLAICGVMTSVFNEMGIKTNDFLPVAPATFSGGPSFHTMVNVIKAPSMIVNWASGNWNVGDASTLKEMEFQAGGMVPLGYQVRYAKKAAEYFQQGDQWKGWLSLTGIPTTPDP